MKHFVKDQTQKLQTKFTAELCGILSLNRLHLMHDIESSVSVFQGHLLTLNILKSLLRQQLNGVRT